MKKLLIFICLRFLYGISRAATIHGIANGDNLSIDFDEFSSVKVNTNEFKNNVCNSGYKGYEVQGKGDTKTAGYVYFNGKKNACVGIILSGTEWYMLGTGVMTIDTNSFVYFRNIKLIPNGSKYYFRGKAITNTMGVINRWSSVTLTGLDKLDWSKSVIDVSNCSNNYYANGNRCDIKIILKNQVGKPFTGLSTIKVKIQNVSRGYNGYMFMSSDGSKVKDLNVSSNGVVNIPIYIIKPGNNIELELKLSYKLPDIGGNTYIIKKFSINAKNPLSKVNIKFKSDLIVGYDITGYVLATFNKQGLIKDYILSGGFELLGAYKNKFSIKKGLSIHSKEFQLNVKEKKLEYKQEIPKLKLKDNSKIVVSYGNLFGGNKKVELSFINNDLFNIYFRGVYLEGFGNNIYKQNLGVSSIGKVSYLHTYNKIRKKAMSLTRGKNPDNIYNLRIDNLKGGIKFYDCNHNLYQLGTGTYYGNNTIILRNCKIKIVGNIYKGNKDSSLVIFMYSTNYTNIRDKNWIFSDGSVYIAENVSDIYASILTNGSIYTIEGDNVNSLILNNRVYSISDKQLFIKGLLLSKNTIGGGFPIKDEKGKIYYTLPGGKKLYSNSRLYGSNLVDEVQIFDLNFWRGFKFSGNGSILASWYSNYCKNNKEAKKCKYAIIVEYSPEINKNILFTK